MDWLNYLAEPHESRINFKKLEKFTLHEQNYISDIDE